MENRRDSVWFDILNISKRWNPLVELGYDRLISFFLSSPLNSKLDIVNSNITLFANRKNPFQVRLLSQIIPDYKLARTNVKCERNGFHWLEDRDYITGTITVNTTKQYINLYSMLWFNGIYTSDNNTMQVILPYTFESEKWKEIKKDFEEKNNLKLFVKPVGHGNTKYTLLLLKNCLDLIVDNFNNMGLPIESILFN